MPPTLVQQPKPTQETPAAPVSTPETPQATVTEAKPESLLKRVASATEKPKETPVVSEAPKVSISIDDVKDPAARQMLQKKLEEANKAISETFGKVGAEKSKYIQEAEALRKQLEQATNKKFSKEDIRQFLNRQDFIQAATELQSEIAPQGVAQEAWSSWTPEEKQAFQRQQQETEALKQRLEAMQQSQVLSQVDSELQTEYPDYDSSQINDFYQKAQSGQLSPKELRRGVYFATNAEKLINRAYELGKLDNKSTIQEKVNGMSPNGLNITPTTSNGVERKDGQRSSTVFSSHAHKVLDMLRNMPKNRN